MIKESLVSVVIPVYNVEEYLDECVKSILEQTYIQLDIILVDDGSKDKSAQMCDAYAERDSRIQVLHKENGGLISAWTAGVKIAKGDYLVFVDSDDWIEPNMIEELVKYSDGSSKEIICSNYIIEKIEKQKLIKVKQSMLPGIYGRKEIEELLFPHLLGEEVRRIHSSRCMKLISKKLIIENLQYINPQISMGEDLSIMFPSILDANRIVVLEEGYFYHYRFVDASMAHKYNASLHEKIELLVKTLQVIIEKKINNPSDKQVFLKGLQKEYIYLLFIVLKNELRGPQKGLTLRIQNILKGAKKQFDLERVVVDVSGMANKLLYAIWKKPNGIRIAMGRTVIQVFDKV